MATCFMVAGGGTGIKYFLGIAYSSYSGAGFASIDEKMNVGGSGSTDMRGNTKSDNYVTVSGSGYSGQDGCFNLKITAKVAGKYNVNGGAYKDVAVGGVVYSGRIWLSSMVITMK